MATREPVDPFNGNESLHILWKHLNDYVASKFDDRPLPAHVEQFLMLFFLGEVGADWVKESMVKANFADHKAAMDGLRAGVRQWSDEQGSLMERVGRGDWWSKI